jgi:hypothetical protein
VAIFAFVFIELATRKVVLSRTVANPSVCDKPPT